MAFNMKNGTPLHGPSLCGTCTNAHIVRGYHESEEIVVCNALTPSYRVVFAVRECSGYIDRTRECLYELRQIAWVLQPRGSKRQAGFVSPDEKREGGSEIELILDGKK